MPSGIKNNGVAFARQELPSITPSPNEDSLVLFERISTKTVAGSAISIPSDYAYGEALELRYSSALSNTQFQGLFMQVDTSVANTSTVRGAEISARNATGIAVGTVEGINGHANEKGTTGDVTNIFGVTGEVGQDSTVTSTTTLMAALRGKLQLEDGSTITNSFCVLAEQEAVTGAKAATAAFGAKSGASGFTSLIDASLATLVAHDTDQVTLITFKDSAGNTKTMSYDVSAGGLVFA